MKNNEIEIVVLVDNYPGEKSLLTRWGLSLFVKVNNVQFLFDTGPDPEALEHNAKTLGVNMNKISFVVISHMHYDHIGGLSYILKIKPDVVIYLPENHYIASDLAKKGVKVVVTSGIMEISNGVFLVNFDSFIREQCAVIDVSDIGIVMLVGCSHPRIEYMTKWIFEHFKKPIYAVIGGFHLGSNIERLKQIAETFRKIGVKEIYPMHCSGDVAREFFSIHLKKIYKDGHVGLRIKFTSCKH